MRNDWLSCVFSSWHSFFYNWCCFLEVSPFDTSRLVFPVTPLGCRWVFNVLTWTQNDISMHLSKSLFPSLCCSHSLWLPFLWKHMHLRRSDQNKTAFTVTSCKQMCHLLLFSAKPQHTRTFIRVLWAPLLQSGRQRQLTFAWAQAALQWEPCVLNFSEWAPCTCEAPCGEVCATCSCSIWSNK